MTPEQLKSSILQYAIQGKLVKQVEEEGTGKELYEIIKKNQDTIKPGKDKIVFDAMNFDIPESWMWVELNQIYKFVDYRGKTPHKIKEGIFLITASNIRQGFMDYTRKEYISMEEYRTRQGRGITKKGDLLFTTEAPMGNAAICDLKECSCGQRIITFQEYVNDSAIPTLFMYFILSPSFQKHLLDNCTGTTAKGIKANKLKHLKIPLPPIKEQHRIVEKIEELLPLIDQYEVAWTKLQQLNTNFPEKMKKSILQYAMQGKLVEQQLEEGTAKELYEKIKETKNQLINKGKIKKQKALAKIMDQEIPFDIPENWKWVRLGDLVTLQSGQDLKKSEYNDNQIGIPYLTGASNIKDNGDIIINRWTETPKAFATVGDLLLTCKGTVGKMAFVKQDKVHIARQIMGIRAYYTDLKYIKYFLETQISNLKNMAKSMIPGIERNNVLNLIIPLPPLEEQKRIVTKIEELIPYCEQLIK